METRPLLRRASADAGHRRSKDDLLLTSLQKGLSRGRLHQTCASSTVGLAMTRVHLQDFRAHGKKTSEEAAPRGSLSGSTSFSLFQIGKVVRSFSWTRGPTGLYIHGPK